MNSLRLPGEGDEAFIARAERAAAYARILTDAALANECIQAYIADPQLPTWTEEGERRNPTIRLDYAEAMAIGGLGETIQATRSKHWGSGPNVLPVASDDPVDPMFITYVFKEGSRYNLRFLQRRRLKELLGKKYRPLVEQAKSFTLRVFLENLTAERAYAIRAILQMEPSEFWRAAKGREIYELPEIGGIVDSAVVSTLPGTLKQQPLRFERPKTREDFARDRDSSESDIVW